MVIWIIAIFVTFLSSCFFAIKCCDKKSESDKNRFSNIVILMMMSAALFVTSLLTVLNANNISVRSAYRVDTIENNELGERVYDFLYYDKTTDGYFVVKYNLWNVGRLTERRVVEKEIAFNLIERRD